MEPCEKIIDRIECMKMLSCVWYKGKCYTITTPPDDKIEFTIFIRR